MQLPQTPSMSLAGRHALVTGASSGIGLGAACALAQAGANVTMVARSADKLAEACEAIKKSNGDASVLALDVGDIDATHSAIEAMPAIDILVNNAGTNRPGPMKDMQVSDFDAVMDLNVKAAYFVAQSVVEKMKAEGKGGVVINMSSQMGHVGGLDRTVYCASKHAIEGLTKAMAIELGEHRIRVNSVCPTFIATPFTEKTLADPEKVAWIESKIKLGRLGQVEDIMGAIVFLTSDAASLITGTSLLIDGGWTAG